jgi:hypothetical protein
MNRYIARLGLAVFVALARWSVGQADTDIWKVAVGNWETGTSWVDGTTPGNSDSATFNLAGIHTATFGVTPAIIQDLTVSAGTVAFQSSGGIQNLQVKSGSGTQTVTVTGATTSLTLGTAPSDALNLSTGGDVTIASGGVLQTNPGSTLSLAANRTTTITSGGRAIFAGDYDFTTPTNATYNISGPTSLLQTISSDLVHLGNTLQIIFAPSAPFAINKALQP